MAMNAARTMSGTAQKLSEDIVAIKPSKTGLVQSRLIRLRSFSSIGGELNVK